jgi:CDP-glucose 4,6-dehydratase
VTGLALPPPTTPNHFELLRADMVSHIGDINDADTVDTVFRVSQPEVVFHLAAQPLVLKSYQQPVETFRTNLQGLIHLLESCRRSETVRAVIVVTSDKCYENRDWVWPYRENDRLGGHDPYSASKAAAEIVTQSYRLSFFSGVGDARVATVRAGNVIGGGDWAENRLLPDVARAATGNTVLRIRSPQAVRPWQHVLDCLSGYLLLGQRLFIDDLQGQAAWNFGPDSSSCRTVQEIITEASRHWPAVRWEIDELPRPIESNLLQLDTSLARRKLHWTPVWDWRRAVAETVAWYAALGEGRVTTRDQLSVYVDDSRSARVTWVS